MEEKKMELPLLLVQLTIASHLNTCSRHKATRKTPVVIQYRITKDIPLLNFCERANMRIYKVVLSS